MKRLKSYGLSLVTISILGIGMIGCGGGGSSDSTSTSETLYTTPICQDNFL